MRPYLTLVAGYHTGAPFQMPCGEDLENIFVSDLWLTGGKEIRLVDIIFNKCGVFGYTADEVRMSLVLHALYEIKDGFDLDTKIAELPVYTDDWDKRLARVQDALGRQVPDNQLYKGFAHYMSLYRRALTVIHGALDWPPPELDKIKLMLVWGWG